MTKPYLIIHHSADPSPEPQFGKIEAYHLSKGFPLSRLGYHVGYHFVIEHDGALRMARLITENGAHTAAACSGGHCNLVGIGVCVTGDFTAADPTDAQLSTLFDLYKNLGYPKLLLHSDVKGTSCPGSFAFIDEMSRRWRLSLKQQLAAIPKAIARFFGTPREKPLRRKEERLTELIHELDNP